MQGHVLGFLSTAGAPLTESDDVTTLREKRDTTFLGNRAFAKSRWKRQSESDGADEDVWSNPILDFSHDRLFDSEEVTGQTQ